MNKSKVSLEELVVLAQKGDEIAREQIIIQLEGQVSKLIKSKNYYLKGGDNNDLMQIGREAVFNAILKFDPNHIKKSNFITFASTCILNALKTAIKKDVNDPFNSSESLIVHDNTCDNRYDPESSTIFNETEQERISKLKEKLSVFEYNVYELKKNGYKNTDIAEKLQCGKKSVENAYNRIKIKKEEI